MAKQEPAHPWRISPDTDLQVISRERSGIFGITILWIMLFHSSLSLSFPPLHLLKSTGYAGVDLFFLLSGIGLYYSMEKDSSPLRFYKKRGARVLLPFWAVAIPYEGLRLALGYITPTAFLQKITLTEYWFNGDMTYWFISAIVVLYLLYPLLYRVIKRRDYATQVLLLTASFALVRLFYENQPLFYRYNGFIFRIPVFLIGCFLAPAVKRGLPLRTVPTLISSLCLILFCLRLWVDCNQDWSWFLRMYLFIPLSFAVALFLGTLLSMLPAKNSLSSLLLFFGSMTLELYLLHEKLLAICSNYLFPNWVGTWQLNGFVFVLCVLGAWCIRKITQFVAKRLP